MTMANRRKDRSSIFAVSRSAIRMALAVATVFLRGSMATQPMQATQIQAPTYTVLQTFTGGADGATPYAGLIPDAAGNLYGTTHLGGIKGCNQGGLVIGCGVVFKLDSGGNETVLYRFTGGADGAEPYGALIRDTAGNVYGTAFQGGVGTCLGGGCGVVFKLDPAGNETVLYSFTGGADGANPGAGLIRNAAGNLYGTTSYGGDLNCNQQIGCGVVFKLDSAGNETVLHTFTGADGQQPGGLIADAAGNLYGAAGGGSGCGVVFKLDPSGDETTLHNFTCGADGAFPSSALIRDAAGNLYGTTGSGGLYDAGTIFKLDPSGNESALYSFTGGGRGDSQRWLDPGPCWQPFRHDRGRRPIQVGSGFCAGTKRHGESPARLHRRGGWRRADRFTVAPVQGCPLRHSYVGRRRQRDELQSRRHWVWGCVQADGPVAGGRCQLLVRETDLMGANSI